MRSEIKPDGDFVKQWIAIRTVEAELDRSILSLIDKHRKGAKLDEAGLLRSLIRLSQDPEDANGSD